MSQPKPAKPKFWETIRAASGPYRRIYRYVRPYKWRFVLGLAFGFGYGAVNGVLPLVVSQVTSFVFHGAAPNPQALMQNHGILSDGPKINSILK
ncbi:MAG: hypothetical protein ACJ8LI_05520, partial [Chthoniobacterales bacterium]